jgi:transposase
MRQVHVAGDKLFVDYAGMRRSIVDATTGEVIEVELFVAAVHESTGKRSCSNGSSAGTGSCEPSRSRDIES